MKMIKRAVSMLLVLCIVLSVAPISALAVLPSYIWDVLQKSDTLTVGTEAVNPFTDISGSDWYYDDVMYVRANGFFNGTSATTFDPDGTMTRGMFVTVLGRMAGVDTAAYAGVSDFSDVSVDQYYAPYVAWASKHGVTTGTGGGKFSPDELIDRQQLATFLVRYFEAFDVIYNSGSAYVDDPADIDSTEDWAKDSVSKLWSAGIMHGTNGKAAPGDDATRAWTASVCHRADLKVSVWYKEPGVRSSRVSIDPAADMSGDIVLEGGSAPAAGSDFVINLEPDEEEIVDPDPEFWYVRFYDGDRLIDILPVLKGCPLNRVPDVEKSSKAEHILLGYYLDPECTEPFYANNNVYRNMKVYAKYEQMERAETLNFTSFARMDQSPNVVYYIRWIGSGTPDEHTVKNAAALEAKDGTDPVEIKVSHNSGKNYKIFAPKGYNEGCTYELTLADGWVFVGDDGKDMAETIRTATFSIKMAQVEKLRMADGIKYIKDTAAIKYSVGGENVDVLTPDLIPEEGGSFVFGSDSETEAQSETTIESNAADDGNDVTKASELEKGDILCIYTGDHPADREASDGVAANGDKAADGTDLLDPVVYVKVETISGDTVSFKPLKQDEQGDIYEIADNFPFYAPDDFDDYAVTEKTVGLDDFFNTYFDVSVYGLMISETTLSRAAMVDKATPKVSVGDFITIYSELPADGDEPKKGTYYYGKITKIEEDKETGKTNITYIMQTKEDINSSMDLYSKVDLNDDLLTDEERKKLEYQLREQIEDSNFGEEAAELMAETAIRTRGFRENMAIENFLVSNSIEDLKYAIESVDIDVSLSRKGRNFKGNSFIVSVTADVVIPVSYDEYISLDLSAEFEQEIYLDTGVKGSIVTKEILFIPVPVGVHVDVSLDIKNFTGFDFDAEVCTYSGGELLEQVNVSDELDEMMETAERSGVSDRYFDAFDELLNRFKDMLEKETDWVTLVEKSLFEKEIFIYGLVVGIECDFVVRTDMSIAIGSNFEYQVGKRYIFWFEIGLFKPSAGSETVDLMDESFAFRFYVLGKMGIRAGIKAKLYAGIGSGKLASVGIAAELGPYVKLYGIFLYENVRYRPQNSTQWQESETMMGALCTEMGMYFVLSFEAEALSLFEYSYEFVNKEFPLLYGGNRRYYYEFAYEPERNEQVVVRDFNSDSSDGISMEVPYSAIAMTYVDLMTGIIGTAAETRGDYIYSVSNPNFSVSEDGTIKVTVPDNTRFMECDLTVTYKHSKLAFSNYDMTATIPLVWTNLTDIELTEYYTVSVSAGNAVDGYETVWSKRVLKSQPFDLPSEEEVKDLMGWDSYIYDDAGSDGYKDDQQLTDLTVLRDTIYYFDVDYREYQLEVTGIQNKNGSTTSEIYHAKFGEVFKFTDFSADEDYIDLNKTGTEIVRDTTITDEQIRNQSYNDTSVYKKFAKLETDAKVQINGEDVPLDLSQPINHTMAEVLANGNVTAEATYVDDSVSAIFCFDSIPFPDVVMRTRRGTQLDIAKYNSLCNAVENSPYTLNRGIEGFNPKLGDINTTTLYIVKCSELTGKRYTISFDENYVLNNDDGYKADYLRTTSESAKTYEENFVFDLENITRMEGGYIGPLHKPTRVGYTFAGWYTDQDTFKNEFTTQNMPGNDVTVYAKWIPVTNKVTFDVNGGDKTSITETERIVTYDCSYGPTYSEGYSVTYTDGSVNYGVGSFDIDGNALPVPTRTGYRFVGWYTARNDGKGEDDDDGIIDAEFEVPEGQRIKVTSTVTITEDTTLYACWKPLVKIEERTPDNTDEIFSFTSAEAVYNRAFHNSEVNKNFKGLGYYSALANDQTNADFSIQITENEGTMQPDGPDGDVITLFDEDDFDFNYQNQSYSNVHSDIINAGNYDVYVVRAQDKYFDKFEETHTNIFHVEKARRTINSINITYNASFASADFSAQSGTITAYTSNNDSGVFVDHLDMSENAKLVLKSDSVNGGAASGRGYVYGLAPNTEYNFKVKIVDDPNYYDSEYSTNTVYIKTKSAPNYPWSGTAAEEGNLSISTANDLFAFAAAVNSGKTFSGKTVTLTANIDLSGYQWTPIGTSDCPFKGTFNGDGYMISGLYCSTPSGVAEAGLFGRVEGARIENVVLYDAYIDGPYESDVGGIVGYALNSTISNCSSYAAVIGGGGPEPKANYGTGGIVGFMRGSTVVDCVNYGPVSDDLFHTAGIVGYSGLSGDVGSTIVNCANFGAISGASCVGGIIGEHQESDKLQTLNCYSVGSVRGTGTYIGAIMGRNYDDAGYVNYCYYLAGSAKCNSNNRNAVGTETGSLDDGGTSGKENRVYYTASFTSASSQLGSTAGSIATGKTLINALNDWRKAGDNASASRYSTSAWFTTTHPTGYYIPDSCPTKESAEQKTSSAGYSLRLTSADETADIVISE